MRMWEGWGGGEVGGRGWGGGEVGGRGGEEVMALVRVGGKTCVARL